MAPWIKESVDTRNVATAKPAAVAFVRENARYLREYRDDADAYVLGLQQTLEAEVRSKFQTKKRVADAERGVRCQVQFDETVVDYLWLDERSMEVQAVALSTSPEQVAARNKIDKKLKKKQQKQQQQLTAETIA